MSEINNQPNQSNPSTPSGQSCSSDPSTPPRHRCLYYEAFTEEEKQFYEIIRDAEALDEEIEMLRVRLYAMAVHLPLDMKTLVSGLHCLNSMCKTNVKYYKRNTWDLKKMHHNLMQMFQGVNIPIELADMKLT
jgi:hypothetical protein